MTRAVLAALPAIHFEVLHEERASMAGDVPPQLPTPLYLARLLMRLDLLEPPYADPTNPTEQAEAAEILPHYQAVFTETNNPLFVWAAYRHARAWRLDVPEWVFAYLDTAAEKFCRVAREIDLLKGSEADVLIAEAVGMKRVGRGTVFSEFRDDLYAAHIELAVRVALGLRAGGKRYFVWRRVAKEFGVKPRMVRRAWDNYKHLLKHLVEPPRSGRQAPPK